MMASSTPTTPIPRRSATLPNPRASSSPDPQIEVLFTLPSVRIIDFQTPVSMPRRGSSGGDGPAFDGESGILPWISRFERTIAVGPFRIYRAPGSVAFLNCQNALRPILPKSQCWAVDDDSTKFVLQIRPPQYWRIEVPNKTPEDKIRAEEFKDVLGKVLLFEKTPCPFQRSFVVELPETPKTIKKIPWKPVERPKAEALQSDSCVEEIHDAAPTTRRGSTSDPMLEEVIAEMPTADVQDFAVISKTLAIVSKIESQQDSISSDTFLSSPNDKETELLEEQATTIPPTSQVLIESAKPLPTLETSLLEENSVFTDSTGLDVDDSYSDATDDTNITPRNSNQLVYQSETFDPNEEIQTPPLQRCSRSSTAPPVLSLITSPPSKHRTSSPLRISTIPESDSDFSSSVESFHSVQSWHSPLAPPSPPTFGSPSPIGTYPYPHDNIVLPKRPGHHSRDASELTVTPEKTRVWQVTSGPGSAPRSRSLSPLPRTPTLTNDNSEKSDDEQFEIVTPPTIRSNIRHRATTSSNSRRRELSPLPAAVNIFSPPRRRPRRLQTARHLPTAIIQKTCEILLSPPSHLLSLMLNIASKIAAGEWRGMLSGQGESVHWDFEDEYAGEGWEDDYGISLPKAKGKARKTKDMIGGSWEID